MKSVRTRTAPEIVFAAAGGDVHQRAAGQSRPPVQAAAGAQDGTGAPPGVHQRPQLRQLHLVGTEPVGWWLGRLRRIFIFVLVDVGY